MRTQATYRPQEPPPGRVIATSDPAAGTLFPSLYWDADAGSPANGVAPTTAGKTGGRDKQPYWNDFVAEVSAQLWLPAATVADSATAPDLSTGWSDVMKGRSWFRATEIMAPQGNAPGLFPPSLDLNAVADMSDAAAETQSLLIRVRPNTEQRQKLRLWFDAARWCYNETVALLTGPDAPHANWRKIKTKIIHSAPERLKAAPYLIKSMAVRDACRAMSEVKRRNAELKKAQQAGLRLDEEYAELRFRSRKAPRQGCYIPRTAVTKRGVYCTILGDLRMTEDLPADYGDSRLTLHNGQYHLAVTHPAQRRASETQGRVVALDPGIRTFLAFFSETSAGLIGQGDFGRIQRLCAHLDDLLSRAKREKKRARKRNMYAAADRARVRIRNLVDELHHQAANWLTERFDLILIPEFETSRLARRGLRRIRSKSVRSMLTFAHYRFRQFLLWKAWQRGKSVLVVNEAYTSRTCSWSGELLPKLGGSRVKRGADGVVAERDIDGARGIFLRALVDLPSLGAIVQGCIAPNVIYR